MIPALGCGAAGFDLREDARIVAVGLDAYEPRSLEDVRSVASSDEEHEIVREIADEVRS